MYTISDILRDIDRGCTAHNMIEDRFSKRYVDTTYGNLRKALENIIRNNLTLTNTIVIAETTVLKDGKCIRLLSRSYLFSLDEYFKRINGERSDNRCGYATYGKYAMRQISY